MIKSSRFFSVVTDGTMCPGVDSASKNEYQGIPVGVKAAGAWGWRPTTLVVPNVKKIRGINLTGTPLGPCGLLWTWPNPIYGPGADSASNWNEYQQSFLGGKGGRCVGLTTLPPSCGACLDILRASTSWKPLGLSWTVMGLFYCEMCFTLSFWVPTNLKWPRYI
jgi:hypothetical protein